MHLRNGHRTRRGGTHPSGFTLLELAVSVLVFSIVAGVTTMAAGRSQLALASSRLEREARSALSSLVSQVSTNPYPALVGGLFPRPEPCTNDPFKSCPEVLGRELEVSWNIVLGPDRLGVSAANPASLELQAVTRLPAGKEIVSSRVVVSPSGGGTGGMVRVRLTGDTYTGPVFLVGAAESVVASGVAAGGEALMRAPVDACPVSAPCRLALSADGGTRNGDLTLDLLSAVGERSGVVLSNFSVTEASAAIVPVTPVHVLLEAWSPEGIYGRAPVAGSVCLWFVFQAGGVTETVPGCNTESADRVVLRTYQPDPNRPLIEVALPQNVNIKVTADHPDGSCPRVTGAVGLAPDGSAWSNTYAACTSYTWGLPTLWGPAGSIDNATPFADASFRLTTSAPRFFSTTWALAEDRAATFASTAAQGMVLLPSSTGAPFEKSAGEATFEARFTPTGTALRQVIFEEGSSAAGMNLYLYAGRLYAGAWSSAWTEDLEVSIPLAAGSEHHVAVTLADSARTLTLYLDGEAVGTDTKQSSLVLASRADRAAIGAVAGSTRFADTGSANTGPTPFDGTVAEFARYERSLPAQEIAGHHAAAGRAETWRRAIMASGPSAYYRFEDIEGPLLRDASGNGQHAALSGPGVNLLKASASTLWGLWRFEGSGTAAGRDSSKNGRDLSLGTGATVAPTGRSGKGLDLDGGPAGSASATTLFVPGAGTTLECWVYVTSAVAGPCVRVGGGADGFSLGVGQGSYSSPGLQITGQVPGYGWLAGQGNLTVNSWNHLTLTISGTNATLYLNGAASGAFTGLTITTPTAGIQVGRNAGSDQAAGAALRGIVDEVAVHTAALSAAEILLRAASSPALDQVGADTGFPATGYSGQAPWTHPRASLPCAAQATCTATTTLPELLSCPGQQCLSAGNAAPLLTSPRRGLYQVPSALAIQSAVAEIGLDDPDGDPLTVTVAAGGVTGGTVTLAGSPIAAGQVIAAGLPTPAVLPALTFVPTSGWTSGSVNLSVSDGTGSTAVTVYFSPSTEGTYPVRLLAGPVQVRQGGTATGDLLAVGDDGDAFEQVAATLSLPAGASAGAAASSNGVIIRTFNGGTAAADLHTATINAAPASGQFRFEVLPAAGNVTVAVTDLYQGGTATATVRVTDGAGAPVSGIGTWLAVEDLAGGPALGVYADVNGCVTGTAGSCSITLRAEPGAASRNYTLSAISGSASGSQVFAVLQKPATIEVSGTSVEQGYSAELQATVYDGAGEPVAGIPLQITGLPDAMGASPVAQTDNTGRTTIVVSAGVQTPPGTYAVSVSDGARASTLLQLTVTSTVASVVADPVAVTQGGVAAVTFTVLDPQGFPVEGASLDIQGSGALTVSSRVTSDAAGDAVLSLRVPNAVETGIYQLPVVYRTLLVGTLTVEVRTGVASVVATGNFTRGQPSTITLRLKDMANLPVADLTFGVHVDEMLASPAQALVTTNQQGIAEVTLTFLATADPGMQMLKLYIDGRWVSVGVAVL